MLSLYLNLFARNHGNINTYGPYISVISSSILLVLCMLSLYHKMYTLNFSVSVLGFVVHCKEAYRQKFP